MKKVFEKIQFIVELIFWLSILLILGLAAFVVLISALFIESFLEKIGFKPPKFASKFILKLSDVVIPV